MPNTYGATMTLLNAGTPPDPGYADGTVRCFTEIVTLASQADGDTITIARLPKGAVFLYGMLHGSASLGSSTIAIGISGTAGKYRASAVHTATVPTLFGVNAAVGAATADEETIIITNTTAALPSSGRLVVQIYYVFN